MVINVLHSIGDILFCEPIYRRVWEHDGKKPTVIIRDHLMWLQEYILSANFLPVSKWRGDIDDILFYDDYWPLRFANQICRRFDKHDHSDLENMMLDKYRILGFNENMWKTMELNFNGDRSAQLFHALGLHPSEDYILINEHSQAGTIVINPENTRKFRVVKMESKPGFNVLDWCHVMALASENHHVSTSTFFVMQAILKLKTPKARLDPVYIYPRPNEDGLRGISQLKPDFNLIRVEK